MRALFLRLLGASLAALVAIQLVTVGLGALRFGQRMAQTENGLVDDKLDWAARRLEALPVAERAPELHVLRPSLAVHLEILPASAPVRRGERAVRLSDGSRLVAMGGGPPPPPLGAMAMQILLNVGVFGLVLAALGRPLFRDLSRLESASRRIAEGELGARSGLADGPAADLGEQFDAMAERVQVLVSGQKELLAAVSHEIRTPLARMRFQLEALRESAGDVAVDRIDGELDAIDALLGELLEMARVDRGPLEPAEPEATAEVVQGVCRRMEGLAPIALDVDVASGLPISRRALARIVENLVSNAQRHASNRVEVRVTERCLIVEDDGPGVPVEARTLVFEPFHTGEGSRNRALGGVGLGLALVKRTAERWGARVRVDAGTLGGARFRVDWA